MADRSDAARVHDHTRSLHRIPKERWDDRQGSVAVPEGFRHPLAPVANPAPPALLPLIGVDDELLPALERILHPIAVRAHAGDWAARDALYAAFEPKLMRMGRRIHVPYAPEGAQGVWEREDVVQETYLVFAGVIESWLPHIPFGRYVMANFPWRLRDAVLRGIGRRSVPPRWFGVSLDAETSISDLAANADEERATIEAIAASFEPPLDDLLRLHILHRQTLSEAGAALGVSRRSATRYWQTILLRLRADPNVRI